MIVVGLTGSIGMGKSTTARMFAEAGAAVFDADAEVHALYEKGGEAVAPLMARFGPDIAPSGSIDRQKLGAKIQGDANAFADLEAIVHPLVGQRRDAFLATAAAEGKHVAVLDVPLLFETGGQERVDAVVVVSAPTDVQRARVLARPGMTEAAFEAILAKQLPDAEKRRRADFVVETGDGIDPAREQVRHIMQQLIDRAREHTI